MSEHLQDNSIILSHVGMLLGRDVRYHFLLEPINLVIDTSPRKTES